jgi:hypothetical protein
LARPKRNPSQDNCINITTKNKKKTTITFAIDDEVLQELRNDAEKEGGHSLNSKINNILLKHVSFYRFLEQQQSIVIPNKNFKFILDNIDEKKLLEEFKSVVFDMIPSDLLELRAKLSIENWIKYVCESTLLYAGAFQKFNYHIDEENRLHLIFRHSHGIKWSRILSSVFTQQMESLLGLNCELVVIVVIIIVKVKNPTTAFFMVKRFFSIALFSFCFDSMLYIPQGNI